MKNFSIYMKIKEYVVLSLFFVMVTFLNNQIFAEGLFVSEMCKNNKLTLTVFTTDGPIEDASVYIYQDSLMKKFYDKMITNSKGQVEFQFSDRTTMVKVTNAQHDDLIQTLSCNEEFRPQSVTIYSVLDSSVGILEDPNTQLTIVDLGSFYGIAGNGTIPDTIKILRNGHLWKTMTKDTGIAPSTSHSEWQILQTAFYNELPGRYKIILLTNNTETLVYEFIVEQITEYNANRFQINNTNDELLPNNQKISESKTAPLKQIANGVSPNDVICTEGMQLVFKNTNNYPACVKSTTVEKLIERGWAKRYNFSD